MVVKFQTVTLVQKNTNILTYLISKYTIQVSELNFNKIIR